MDLDISNIIFYITELIQIIIFIFGCYFFSISIFGFIKRKNEPSYKYLPKKKFALVIAAHNEEPVIKYIIESLKKQNYPQKLYDIFVVADNCNDETSKVAKNSGAYIFDRHNDKEKGKGYALEWIFNKIFALEKKYDAICVFDADNIVSTNFLIEMNKHLIMGNKVIQGYIDSKNPFDSWITCSYSIAFWLSNRMFQLPRYYLGLNASLCGTGFCVDINTLKEVGWGATCLTEDLEFTMKLALKGIKISWAHDAIVYDEKPLTFRQSWKQRKRWMQGHADCATRFLPALFSKAFKHLDIISFDCALYLFQPIRFIFIGLITLMMWFQTVFPESPFYNLKYLFPTSVWVIFVILQFIYGPLVIIMEKKFNLKVLLGFLVYPFYCLTWVPITIHGFLGKNNKSWIHTVHSREITIGELEN